jgi:hypothetical protein
LALFARFSQPQLQTDDVPMTYSVSVSVNLDIPERTLVYDIGAEQLCCRVCNANEALSIINSPVASEKLPSIFKNFANKHGKCLLKLQKKRIREEATQPCRQDYHDSRGHGPHECGKTTGHYGSCGSS